MNMKERIARRLCVLTGFDPDECLSKLDNDESKETPVWHEWIDNAEDILYEMLNPTDDMIDSVYGKNDVLRERYIVERDFKIMIQAAIDGK